jgi:hypothetical protein
MWRSRQSTPDGLDNRSDLEGTFNHLESRLPHVVSIEAAKRGNHDHAIRRQKRSHLSQCCPGIGQPTQIDEDDSGLRRSRPKWLRQRPGVHRQHLVSFFDELCAKQHPFRPLRNQERNVGALDEHRVISQVRLRRESEGRVAIRAEVSLLSVCLRQSRVDKE